MNDEYIIEENKNVALIKLNQTWQVPDKINIIKYYKEDGGIDFILAIGKGSGFGPDYYSIVQEHEETLVISVSNRPSDVSTLIHSEKALCYCDPNNTNILEWYILTDIEEGGIWTRHFERLDPSEARIFRNLDDGFRWFFVNGVLKREDDFLNESETIDLVTQNIEYFRGPTFDIVLYLTNLTEEQQALVVKDENNYYLPTRVDYIEKPKFSIHIYNYRGEDVTNRYTLSLESGEHLELMPDGKYMVWGRWENDFNLAIQATRNSLTSTETLNIWFPEIAMYGGCIESTIDSELLFNQILKEKNVYHNLEHLDLDFDLENQKSILLMPQGFEQFSHIYDYNGLDYIKDYTYHPEGFVYRDVEYPAYYIKNEPIVRSNFEQRFTFLDEFLDIPNSGWLRELDREDYYTKEQIDLMFAQYPLIRIDGFKMTIGDRDFRLEPWIDIADYYIGFSGGTRANFFNKTKAQLLDGATPYMVQSTPTFAFEYTEDQAGLYIFYIIMRFNVSIVSGSLRSGNLLTEYSALDFLNPTYFDIIYNNPLVINNTSYNVIGVRGTSLNDPGNEITLNLVKY